MRLFVKQGDRTVSEFRFSKGPIYIGRHTNSQILLPDRRVSRQHATIFKRPDGKWMLEDLDSANKTYLNDKSIHQAEIKTGDQIRIADFTIEVALEDEAEIGKEIHLEDTLITVPRKLRIIIREPDAEHAPDIRLPAKRAKDFIQATEVISKANGADEVLKTLINILFVQFNAYSCWCALRNEPDGPMTSHLGKRTDGNEIQISEIKLNKRITEAVDKKHFLLLPQVPEQKAGPKICSAIIAPIISEGGCFGVLYVDNEIGKEPYSTSDLDYLMLIAIHTAVILENF
jgi:pSer/pThr/pTyr-binding forkhead associated (FHA) protein